MVSWPNLRRFEYIVVSLFLGGLLVLLVQRLGKCDLLEFLLDTFELLVVLIGLSCCLILDMLGSDLLTLLSVLVRMILPLLCSVTSCGGCGGTGSEALF